MYQRANKTCSHNLKWHLALTFSFVILTGCATLRPTNISNVPTINVANVKVPPLKNIPQKTVSVNILDNRDSQYRENTEALQRELRRAVTLSLKSQGIAVNSTSTNVLLMSVQDQQVGEYKDGCVKMNAMLAIPQVANLYSDATSCFEMKSPVSDVSMGSDINQAYEMALSTVFQNLSTNLLKLTAVKK
ncbi:hypothetical protein [Bdellovibrio svalbardensis]|uniref:Lipoprotein n=1 Tax=Bdellovibrio svalbardensis TaxID=2972972 RepID=A0ABT6DLW0_9BACT|nr:hypothetical protein [Bdellovibrio svalbardensis]MDG0817584.1 hypothetical protein [Bdellovibrio svalbardensis]